MSNSIHRAVRASVCALVVSFTAGSVGAAGASTDVASPLGSSPRQLTNVAGTLFFTADDGVHGRELWRSDGTADGTSLVADIAPGSLSADPLSLTAVGGTLFFSADDGVHGRELWTSDGTPQGTSMVRDVYPGRRRSAPHEIHAVGGRAFFVARSPYHGFELWRSDGTETGTRLVKDINKGGGRKSNIRNLTDVAGRAYFSANDGVHGNEIWSSDGTPVGTRMLGDLNTVGRDWPFDLEAVGDRLFFAEQTDDSQLQDLWVTDGTVKGTSVLGESALDLTNVDGELFYEAYLRPGTLAKSDGTPAGTVPVFAPSGGSRKISHLHAITAVGARAFFVAGDGLGGVTGQELWVSDGTTDGTTLVKDINPSGKSDPSDLTAADGLLFFRATTRQAGAELWVSDGTAAGTMLVDDLRAGTGGGAPSWITPVGDSVFFRANDGVHGAELWVTDGTTAGTAMVSDIA